MGLFKWLGMFGGTTVDKCCDCAGIDAKTGDNVGVVCWTVELTLLKCSKVGSSLKEEAVCTGGWVTIVGIGLGSSCDAVVVFAEGVISKGFAVLFAAGTVALLSCCFSVLRYCLLVPFFGSSPLWDDVVDSFLDFFATWLWSSAVTLTSAFLCFTPPLPPEIALFSKCKSLVNSNSKLSWRFLLDGYIVEVGVVCRLFTALLLLLVLLFDDDELVLCRWCFSLSNDLSFSGTTFVVVIVPNELDG